VTALQPNELVDKNKNNINWNVKSGSLTFPTLAHVGVPSEFFDPIQTGLLFGLLGLERADSAPSSLTPRIFNNNNNSKIYNVKKPFPLRSVTSADDVI